jgi:hypothetical protein
MKKTYKNAHSTRKALVEIIIIITMNQTTARF